MDTPPLSKLLFLEPGSPKDLPDDPFKGMATRPPPSLEPSPIHSPKDSPKGEQQGRAFEQLSNSPKSGKQPSIQVPQQPIVNLSSIPQRKLSLISEQQLRELFKKTFGSKQQAVSDDEAEADPTEDGNRTTEDEKKGAKKERRLSKAEGNESDDENGAFAKLSVTPPSPSEKSQHPSAGHTPRPRPTLAAQTPRPTLAGQPPLGSLPATPSVIMEDAE